MRRTAFVAALAGALLFAGAATAQTNPDDGFDDSVGAREFMNHCAACHGESAKGDGPLSKLLTVEVADLTTIKKRNGGAFPLMRVMRIIDGRNGLRGHGAAMPVWGDRFTAQSDKTFGPYDVEAVVRGRILELAFYLQVIQE